jgi:hypothetical protein
LDELQRELASSPDAAEQYRTAMRQLAELAPDLWLPALPVFGQNANLYDEQWRTLIEQNLALATAHR